MAASLTREDHALLCAVRPAPSPERRQQLAGLLATPFDWPGLIALADRHGVVALLHTHIRLLGSDRVPPTAREALAVRARAVVAWNLRLGHELSRILAALGQAGIPVMPLKGPVLASLLYPDPLLRFSADLDLLIRPHDCAAGERTLRQAGYRRLPPHEQGADYHTIFMSEDAAAGGVVVELHHELGERHVSGPDVRAIWASASASIWEGHPIWSMALPNLLLYLCFHAAKDGLASIKALLDITLLVERHRDTLPWNDLASRVKTARVSSPVYLALSQSRALLGAPVPDGFFEAIRPRHPSWRLAEALFRWRGGVLHVPEDLLVGPFMAILMLLWEDSLAGKSRHLRRNLFPSASLRARWTSVPSSASWPIWYPVWLWHATRHVARQVIASVSVRPRRSPPSA